MLVASFGDEFKGADVEYCTDRKGIEGSHMHTVKYIRDGEEGFTNYVFNEDRKAGEADSLDMAREFVKQRSIDGKPRI